MKKLATLLLTALLCSSFVPKQEQKKAPSAANGNVLYMLVGTYTSGSSKGIYVYRFNMENGQASYVSEIDGIANPSYLTVSKNEKFIYSVSQNDRDDDSAIAYSFNKKTGTLKYLNTQKTNGASPCFINIDKTGKYVITANYSGGNVTVFPTNSDGTLLPASQVLSFTGSSIDKERQTKPYIHCVTFSPDGKFLFADDLGTDQVHIFSTNYLNPDTFLAPEKPAAYKVEAGSGPRHLAFHPNGKYAYLINELSGKVTAFQYKNGTLKAKQYIASDTTPGIGQKGSADIHLTPDGKFLYASNRLKDDGIAIFKVNQINGTLTKVGYQPTGIHPRNFVIAPNGKYLLAANRDSNSIQIFRIDQKTGLLKNMNKDINIDRPVCLKFISLN